MTDKKPLFDFMIEVHGKAISDNRAPRRWEINQAAKAHLMADHRIYRNDFHSKPLEDCPLFGVPIVLLTDNSDDPKFNLIIDDRPREMTLVEAIEIEKEKRWGSPR